VVAPVLEVTTVASAIDPAPVPVGGGDGGAGVELESGTG
jgi:hypothetical protein